MLRRCALRDAPFLLGAAAIGLSKGALLSVRRAFAGIKETLHPEGL